jgi:prepilin-type processing-associated H-X9-DG protein
LPLLPCSRRFYFPSLSRAKAQAQQAQCINNLHQFGVGLHNFLANNGGYPSWGAPMDNDYPRSWVWQLEIYGLGVPESAFNFHTGIWRCPAAQFRPLKSIPANDRLNYFYNCWGLGTQTNRLGLGGYFPPDGPFIRTREPDVVAPADMMAFADNFEGFLSSARFNLDYLIKQGNTLTRHQGRGNVVFCDGHIESPMLQVLFVDTNDEALSRWNCDHQPHRELLSP